MKNYLLFSTCLFIFGLPAAIDARSGDAPPAPQVTPFQAPTVTLPPSPLPTLHPPPTIDPALISPTPTRSGSPTATPTPTPTPLPTDPPRLSPSPSPSPADSTTASWLPWIIVAVLVLFIVFLLGRRSGKN